MIQATETITAKGKAVYIIETDPTNNFTHITFRDLKDALGYIPDIMFDPKHKDLNLWDALNAGYQHGGGLTIGEGTLGKDLSFTFPGDVPLMPLAEYTRGKEKAYQYQYGLMMVEKDGKFVPTRMD